MKFAHLADVHLGGWKEPKMQEVAHASFSNAISLCIGEKVDFVLIAGDLFNTSVPGIDTIKLAVSELKRFKEKGIPVYLIAGSHDFSPSGKTMLDVLEEADLFVNVCKGQVGEEGLKLDFTVDTLTGAKITGMLGRKGMLDKKYYEGLDRTNLESETGFKIFMFHTAITEMKTSDLEKMDSEPISMLPLGFDYYAGGHVHIVKEVNVDSYKNVIYPGPTYPNSFSELEKLGSGSMYLYNSGKIEMRKIQSVPVVSLSFDASGKTPEEVTSSIVSGLLDVSGKIVLLRAAGVLKSGKASDVDFRRVFEICEEKGAYFVMKNANKLTSKDFEEVKIEAKTSEEAERGLIEENTGQLDVLSLGKDAEKELVMNLMMSLNIEKNEGEKNSDYEDRVVSSARRIFDV